MTSDGVFSATMSYHTMLKCAQQNNPLTTYVLCKLLLTAPTKERAEKSLFVLTEEIKEEHRFYHLFGNLDHMKNLCSKIFGDEVVAFMGPSGLVQDGFYYYLRAYKVFVDWLRSINITLHDDTMSVTIPA